MEGKIEVERPTFKRVGAAGRAPVGRGADPLRVLRGRRYDRIRDAAVLST